MLILSSLIALCTVYATTIIDCSITDCQQKVLNCAASTDCHIDCSQGVCVNSTINCPDYAACYLKLGIGLQLIQINAQNSLYFELETNSMALVENMIVYCPQNGYAGDQTICRFKGDQYIDCDIYAQEGFRDVFFDAGQSLDNMHIHCGLTTTEYTCLAKSDGSACTSTNTICNSDFLLPTIKPSPTPSPSNTPNISPTASPTPSPTTTTTTTTTAPSVTKAPTTSPTTTTPSVTTKPPTPTPPPTISPDISSSTSPTNFPTSIPSESPSNMPVIVTSTIAVISTLTSLNGAVISEYSRNQAFIWNLVVTGYTLVILFGFGATVCTFTAFRYHRNVQGCDMPNYFALWKYFINIADLYTDFIFCIVLYLSDNVDLFIVGILFVSVSHLLSVLFGLYMVHLWRNDDYKFGYVNKYDNVIIGLAVLCGFYPCISLLSSKLFHHPYTSLHLTLNDKYRIQRKRFLIHNLLENIPLMIVQIVAMNKQPEINPITLVALTFGVFSIIHEILTFLSRICAICRKELNERAVFKLNIISCKIKKPHLYSHKLTANALASCLAIQSYRIETISMISIVNGVSCNIGVLLDDDEIEIDGLMKDLNDTENEFYMNCKMALSQCWNVQFNENDDLKIISIKVDGSVIRLRSYNPPKIQLMNIDNENVFQNKRESMSESEQIEGPRETIVDSDSSSSSHQTSYTVTNGLKRC